MSQSEVSTRSIYEGRLRRIRWYTTTPTRQLGTSVGGKRERVLRLTSSLSTIRTLHVVISRQLLASLPGQYILDLWTQWKRVRNNNCEEECCDFMPLSKRINNLHINNGNFCTSLGYQHLKHSVTKQTDIFEPSSNDWLSVEAHAELGGNELLCYQSYTGGDGCHAAAQSTRCASSAISQQPQQSVEVGGSGQSLHPNSWISNNILSQYSPSLNASDNPYYYESNKLLFALYMERIHRNGDIVY